MRVSVVYAPQARQIEEVDLNLIGPCSVTDALRHSGLMQRFPEIDLPDILVGIWGCQASLQRVLKEHDRVEVYRALRVDPKTARRERFVEQGARTTGLFVRKRPGAKAGY